MNTKRKSGFFRLKGRFDRINIWLEKKHIPPRMLFIITGIASTIWFLLRVIPKPSRASYPCMRAAAPVMSGFVVYLISLGGMSIALRKAWKNLTGSKYLVTSILLILTALFLVINLTSDLSSSSAQPETSVGPEDGPNKPFGKGGGINAGRVVWAWNPDATNENCKNVIENNDWYFNPVNADQKIIGNMVSESVKKISGKSDLKQSWDGLFRYHNLKKFQKNKGYTTGEKIFINMTIGYD